jgi:hypothetical protein
MSGTVAEVIAQLAQASTGLTSAAATALRAQQDAIEAHQALNKASTGTAAPAVTNATTEWKTAADKAGKVARLFLQAAAHLNAYSTAEESGRRRDADHLSLDVDVEDSRALTFYGSLGYTVVRPHQHRWQSLDPDTGAVLDEGTAATLIMRHQLL